MSFEDAQQPTRGEDGGLTNGDRNIGLSDMTDT